MKIVEILKSLEEKDQVGYSIEFFPPKTEKGVENLTGRLERYLSLEKSPLFVDLTWGAGGTTSERSLGLASSWTRDLASRGCVIDLHLTCTNMDPALVDQTLAAADRAGISNIVALRGDPPENSGDGQLGDGQLGDGQLGDGLEGFTCARNLVRYIRDSWKDRFCIAVAGYPEGHPDAITLVEEGELEGLSSSEKGRLIKSSDGTYWVCRDKAFNQEIGYLVSKVHSGADLIITQMFFDVQVFFAFVRECRWAGISCPILPGIMLIQNLTGFRKMTKFCKTRVPDWLEKQVTLLESLEDSLEKGEMKSRIHDLGVSVAVQIAQELMKGPPDARFKIRNIHWYVLNQEEVMFRVLKELKFISE